MTRTWPYIIRIKPEAACVGQMSLISAGVGTEWAPHKFWLS